MTASRALVSISSMKIQAQGGANLFPVAVPDINFQAFVLRLLQVVAFESKLCNWNDIFSRHFTNACLIKPFP